MYRQASRLPMVPVGSDPRADWFKCERYDCRLPKVGCVNRYRLARQRTQDGPTYEAVQFGGCHRCHVGAAHAAGLPTPPFNLAAPAPTHQGHTSMEETTSIPTNGHPARVWPERTCARCKEKFTPHTARERRCSSCVAASGAPSASAVPKRRGRPRGPAKKVGRGRRGNGAVHVPTASLVGVSSASEIATAPSTGPTWQPKPLSATSKSGVLKPSQIATATELLELAGYKVTTVHTPAGEFLRVL